MAVGQDKRMAVGQELSTARGGRMAVGQKCRPPGAGGWPWPRSVDRQGREDGRGPRSVDRKGPEDGRGPGVSTARVGRMAVGQDRVGRMAVGQDVSTATARVRRMAVGQEKRMAVGQELSTVRKKCWSWRIVELSDCGVSPESRSRERREGGSRKRGQQGEREAKRIALVDGARLGSRFMALALDLKSVYMVQRPITTQLPPARCTSTCRAFGPLGTEEPRAL